MATPSQSAAARGNGAHSDPQRCARSDNGAHSHGPVTPEGKAISSRNSLRHGLCSKQIVLPGEDPREYERHRAAYHQHYRPLTQPEIDQVDIIAATCWRLKRVMAFETALLSGEETDPLQALALIIRYENQLNRTRDQAAKLLKDLQENRPRPLVPTRPPAPQPAATAPQRNEPEPAAGPRLSVPPSPIHAAATTPAEPSGPSAPPPSASKSAA